MRTRSLGCARKCTASNRRSSLPPSISTRAPLDLALHLQESLRKNFTLIYELVDEILDYGHPQCASTAELQAFVFNEPAAVSNPVRSAVG